MPTNDTTTDTTADDRPEAKTKTLRSGDEVHEADDCRFVSSPAGTVHERREWPGDAHDYDYHPKCGQRLPAGSMWGWVEAASPAEAVLKYDLKPCSKCIENSYELDRQRKKRHSSLVMDHVDEKTYPFEEDDEKEVATDGGTTRVYEARVERDGFVREQPLTDKLLTTPETARDWCEAVIEERLEKPTTDWTQDETYGDRWMMEIPSEREYRAVVRGRDLHESIDEPLGAMREVLAEMDRGDGVATDGGIAEVGTYEVTFRYWGPDHEPGEADWDHVTVEAADEEEAREQAVAEATGGGIKGFIEREHSYDVVEIGGPYDV